MSALSLAMGAVIVASIADVVTTRAGLLTGRVYESNPIMRWATRTTTRAIGAKALGLLLVGWQLRRMAPEQSTSVIVTLWACAIVTGYLAYNNFRLTRALTGSSCAPSRPVADSSSADPALNHHDAF